MRIRTLSRRAKERREERNTQGLTTDTHGEQPRAMTHRHFLKLVGATLGVGLASQVARPLEAADAQTIGGAGVGGSDEIFPNLTVASANGAADGAIYLGNTVNTSITSDGMNLIVAAGTAHVGIGVSPSYALDVNGSIAISNNFGRSGKKASCLYLASGDPNHFVFSTGTGDGNMFFGEWNGNFHFWDTASQSDVMTLVGPKLKLGGNLIADPNGCYYA